jgi:hypothetical protein
VAVHGSAARNLSFQPKRPLLLGVSFHTVAEAAARRVAVISVASAAYGPVVAAKLLLSTASAGSLTTAAVV